MATETIDAIKRRMIKNASKIWGYQDVQDINSFDPVLGLIIGALAEELHNVSKEIHKSDARIVEKLLELLFNQNIYTHFPAHAVAYAKPTQPKVELHEFYQFYATKSVPSVQDEKLSEKREIYFTPLNRHTLFNAEVKYVFAGNVLFETDGRYKERIAQKSKDSINSIHKLTLGIKLDNLVENLDGLSLFFFFKNLKNEDLFYQLLYAADSKINGREVAFKPGVNTPLSDKDSIFELIKQSSTITDKSKKYISDFYTDKFISLNKHPFTDRQNINESYEPDYLKEFISGEKALISNESMVWVEFNLSQPLPPEYFDELVISLNCFPVINRALVESTYSINKGINILPLHTNQLFFDVNKVSDSKNNVYVPKSSVENQKNVLNYTLRQGGVARFDSRDARETVNNLIGVVRDEAAAFSAAGADLVSSELKQLDQILSRLQQRINNADISNDLNTFIILESKSSYDKIFVEFWSIAGVVANNLRPGSKLTVYRGMDLNDNTVALVTPTVGGRQKLSKEDKLNSLRRVLLSKGRIVTREDIKILCFEQFGEVLENIEIKKGVNLYTSEKKGLSRTLDIYLTLGKSSNLTEEELWHKKEGLKIRLKQESINLLPYRIFIKSE